jgi:hypothetical protein
MIYHLSLAAHQQAQYNPVPLSPAARQALIVIGIVLFVIGIVRGSSRSRTPR